MPEQVRITAEDEFFTGCDKVLQFSVVDGDGTAVNITGWGLEWALYPFNHSKNTTAVITRTVGTGITITSGVGGVLQVTVTDDLTDTLKGGEYYHELRRIDPGLEDVLAYGSVVLRQSPRV